MRWYGRLRRQADIAYTRRRGKRLHFTTFVAYLVDMRCSSPRVGVTISKAVGKAVVRNRIRRRLRGALDALGPILPPRTALLMVVRPEAAAASYEELLGEVARLRGTPAS